MMKQILRHIFLLVALFMATTNVWAECYAFEESTEYNKKLNQSQTYNLGGKPGAILSFQAKKRSGGTGKLRVDQKINDSWQENIWSDGLTTSWKDYTNIPISRYATEIRLYNTGTLAKDFKNVKITWASYVDAPQGFTNNAWPAGTDIVGNSAQKTATIAWSDATFTWELLNNTDNQFSASFSSTGATCTYGTSNITITYLRTKPGNHSATLKITASTGATYTIALSGVTGKYIPQAAKKMDMVMNESYNPSDIFDVYYLANNVKNTISDYTIKALDPTIANYVGGKIVTNYQTGTARFQLTREADTNFDVLNTTISVNINPARGCYAIYNAGTGSDIAGNQGAVSEAFALIGAGDILTFKYKLNSSTGDATWMHYVTPQYSEEESGNNFDYIRDANGNVYREETKSMSYKTSSSIPIPINAKRIRFERTANGTGGRTVKITEINVTRKQLLDPQLVNNSLELPQATKGKQVSASFDLSWSTCSDEIVLVSTNSNFVLNQYSIDATSGRGTTTITVTYDANSGSQSGTIIIYDQSQKIEIPVSCEVKPKLTTEIIYTGEATYPETPDGILYPFYVKDENGNTVQEAAITLETSNEDILSFDETKIYPHCGGYVTLTATYAGDETHEPASKEQQIFVLECYQHIVWDQNFKTYLATEEGYIDETTLLTAYAVTADGIPTENPIQYTLDEKADSIADIQYNGDGTYSLHVHGVGKGHIIARAMACTFDGEQYIAAESMHELRVRKVGEKCETMESVVNQEFSLSGLLFWENKEKVCSLDGRPYSALEFYSHVNNDSYDNHLEVSFSTDNQATWTTPTRFEDISNVYNWNQPFVCNSIPDGATHVKFRAESTRSTYINMVAAAQRSYFEVDQTAIEIMDAKVNVPFTRQLVLSFSDVPLIRYHVTNSHDLNLTLTPDRPVENDCGDWGEYTFTLTGESPYPQENVTDTITFYTSAGDVVKIPLTITATLSEPFYFNIKDGEWNDPNNWTYQGATGKLPDKQFPIVISKNMTVNNGELVAYGVTIAEGGSVNIQPTGGITLHAGGFTNVTENNFEVYNNHEGAGYVRVSKYFKQLGGQMPKMKVHFTTKANMNNGGNKDATWQYIGAPGSGVGMDLAHTTVLYLRSEEKGWVRQYTEWAQLTPFAGYALTQKEQETFTLYPQLLNENITISLTYTENGMRGDNLWANSYAAPLDITKFTPEDFSGEVDQTFYLYNSGSWNQWNNNQSSTDNASDFTPGRYYAINQAKIDQTKDQTVIPPMQGVYMKAKLGGGTITLNYEKHVWNNTQTAKMNTPLRVAGKEGEAHTQSLDFQRIRLQVNSENSGADRMYIIQDSVATAGYDNGYDAPKLMADGLVNIYTNEPFGKMEISSTDHMDGMYIGFHAGEDTHYIMTFTSLVGDSLYLYDLEEDKFVEMLDGEQYHFSAIAQSTNDMRFQVLVAPTLPDETPGQGGGVTTDVENITMPQLWISDRKVFVSNAKPNSTMAIYTASGMLVTAPYTLHTTPYTLDLSYLPTGVYVLRLNDQAYKFVCK